jgi:hypothetical protein
MVTGHLNHSKQQTQCCPLAEVGLNGFGWWTLTSPMGSNPKEVSSEHSEHEFPSQSQPKSI